MMLVISDPSLVPPIRQTASIFKQPVTLIKSVEGNVKAKSNRGNQEKPKQVFWQKRLEGMRPCNTEGHELQAMELPGSLKAVGPYVTQEIILQSLATTLHVSNQPIIGQTSSNSALQKNAGAFINCDQPLVQAFTICEEDIKGQENKVSLARKNLENVLKNLNQ